MLTKELPSYDLLRETFDYRPLSGELVWIKVGLRSSSLGHVVKKNGLGKYPMVKLNGVRYRAHRLIWVWMTGAPPQGEIDHINRDPTDNRWCNLRDVSPQTNQRNRRPSSNKYGIVGVSRGPYPGWGYVWKVRIVVDNKSIGLGRYYDFFDACCARKSAENRYGWHI